ncbi:MAG: hypothetical protein V1746_01040 [bacterium]
MKNRFFILLLSLGCFVSPVALLADEQEGATLPPPPATASSLAELPPEPAASFGDNSKKGGVPIEITADGENRFEGGIAYASGNVIVRHGEDVVYADEIACNTETGEIIAKGNVRIYSKGKIYRSDQVTYNFHSQKILSSHFYTVQERFFASGKEFITKDVNKHYTVRSGSFTTDNRENPAYRLDAKTIEIYPNDRVVLKNAVFYIGKVPVFWLPYAVYSLKKDQDMMDISVGSSTRWGVYALASYSWALNEKWSGALNLDYRNKRGFGGGVDVDYHPNKMGHASLKSFWTHDDGNDIDVGTLDRPLEPPARRFRFDYKHHAELGSDLITTADINIWSDRHVTQDYFPKEFNAERAPDNFADMMYYNPNFTLTLLGRTQVNNLFEVVERKPELSLEFKRQKIPYTPLSYEGEMSMVNFERVYDRDTDPQNLMTYRAVRYDMFHQILYPRQYWGWLSITPRAGFRATYYSRNNDLTDADPEGDLSRCVFNTGVEASFKVSKTWLDIQNERWGIDGLRHVAEPFLNFSYVPASNEGTDKFRGFDDRIANTQIVPINYPSYNSIDSIDKVLTLRHGIRNKIQTKRDGENVDLFDWALYGDLDMEHRSWGVYTDSAGVERVFRVNHVYPELHNDVVINPLPWLRMNIDSAAGLSQDSFDEVNSKVTWQLHPSLEASVGFHYLDNVPFADNSSLITCGTFWRLNEDWQVSQDLAFESNDGTIQEQRYTLYRDLTSWNVAVSVAWRGNRGVQDEFLTYLSLTLKAFPEKPLSASY